MPERVSLTAVHDQTTAFPLIWPQVRDTLLAALKHQVQRVVLAAVMVALESPGDMISVKITVFH